MKNLIQISLLLACMSFTSSPIKLPKVLLIGDSISMGYLPYVQELMAGKAIVDRIPLKPNGESENCEGTTNGIANIDRWLGDTKWDVIHFNFGLHDIKHVNTETGKTSNDPNDPLQADLNQYAKNLIEIVEKLKSTGANLIFTTTTPYPDNVTNPLRDSGMSEKYNKVANEIMKRNNIPVNDLYSYILPRLEELQIPNNVHFKEEGYKVIGQRVALIVSENLNNK